MSCDAVTDLLGDGRLVIVSNRAPFEMRRRPYGVRLVPTVGGLVSAFTAVFREARTGLWIAWPGSGEWPGQGEGPHRIPFPADDPCLTLRCVNLSERDVSEYYYGFSDRGLWPLAHYFVGRCQFRGDQWQGYRRANGVFAAALLEELQDGDLVWVQDFHLTLVPALARAANSRVRLGFFWHIPFPEPSVFGILPWRGPVLEGMLGSDVIGFHLERYARNFLNCVQQFLGLRVDLESGKVSVGGRKVRVVAHPIGVDAASFERAARQPEVVQRAARIRRQLGSERVALGVDRLDYTKGILERLGGFERLLVESPEFRRKITLVQIAVPSRERVEDYRRMKKDIDEAVGRISGRFTSEGWVPISYIYRAVPQAELTAYYAAADLALVTPLRDGMNLVAKEYVATRVEDDGVLILSEFAGAAEDMPEAVRVNPYSVDDLAAQLRSALAMPPEETRSRMKRLRTRVRERDIWWWLRSLLAELRPVPIRPLGTAAGK